MFDNSVTILKSFDANRLACISHQLNTTGFANDEDSLELGSTLIEHWNDSCTRLLREHGYTGEELRAIGKYFPEKGAVYVLYDEGRHSLEDARQELERVGKLP